MSKRICVVAAMFVLFVSAIAQQTASTITEIEVRGNKNVSTEAILARMRTKVGQPYVQAQLDEDKVSIEQLGFFKAVDIKAAPLEGSNWKVTVDVQEFDVVKEIRVVGNTVVPTELILKNVPIVIGQPFNLSWQRPASAAIEKLYADKGYFARIEELEPLEDSPGTVSIAIREMKVNSLTLRGNTRTKDWVMQRLIKTRAGDAFNINKWSDDLRRVFGTQWFERVDPIEKDAEEGFGVDLGVDVKEARTGQLVIGATMDPRSNFAGQFRVADSNFNGTGQTIGLNLQQAVSGGGGPSVDLDYTHPFIDRYDTSFTVNLYSRLLYRFTGSGFGTSGSPTDEQFTERRTGASMGLVRPLNSRTAVTLGVKYENIKTSDLNTQQAQQFIQQDGSSANFILGYNRNRRDVDIDPSRGDWLNLVVEPGFSNITREGGIFANQSNLGRHNWIRSTLEYRAYLTSQPPRGRQLDAPRRVLAFRARYGYISGKVPFFEQYFAGGSDSIRGYEDDRFWGQQQLITSLEYRHPIQKQFAVVGFVDYGGAWGGYGTVGTFEQSDKAKLHLGYGVGVSFRSPLGPIRLDLGFNERGKSRTHFLIGTSF